MVERTIPVREEVLEKRTVIDEVVKVLFEDLPDAIKRGDERLVGYYKSVLEGFLTERNPNFFNEFMLLEIPLGEKKRKKIIELRNSSVVAERELYLRELIRYATAFLDRIKTVRQVLVIDVSGLKEFMANLKTESDLESEQLIAEGEEIG